jgi:PEP-CTERM motif
MKSFIYSAFLAAMVSVPALGAPIRIGVIGGSDSPVSNVASDLSALGLFSTVDALSNTTNVATLLTYDAILFYTNGYSTLTTTGENLADYVDAGGGLVTATFLMQNSSNALGRFGSEGYSPFSYRSSNSYGYVSMATFDAGNPIFQGPLAVNSIGGYYHDDVNVDGNATVAATWSDGRALVAIDGATGVVGINLFPNDYYGTLSGDYMNLFGNALYYAADASPAVPEPSSMVLAGLGLLGVVAASRRRKT